MLYKSIKEDVMFLFPKTSVDNIFAVKLRSDSTYSLAANSPRHFIYIVIFITILLNYMILLLLIFCDQILN